MRSVKTVYALAGFFVAASLFAIIHDAKATRNSSGTYALPAGNPAVPNTLITSSQWNSNFSDLGNEVTDSLSRSGKGGMLAPVRGIDGAAGAPAYSYSSETTLGDYRKAAGTICRSVASADVTCWDSTGQTVTGKVAASGAVTAGAPSSFTGDANHAPITLVPQAAPAAPANGELWVDTGTNTVKARINGATKDIATTDVSPVAAVGALYYDSTGVVVALGADTKFNSFANATTVGAMTNDGTGKITVTNAATYRIFVSVFVNTSSIAASTFNFTLKVRKNGSAFVTASQRSVTVANAVEGTGSLTGEFVVSLAASDFIELYYNASGGGAGNALIQQAQMTVQRVS